METAQPNNSSTNPTENLVKPDSSPKSGVNPLVSNSSKQKNLLPIIIVATILVLGISAYAIYTFLSMSVTVDSPEQGEQIKGPEIIPSVDTSTSSDIKLTNVSFIAPKDENLNIFKPSTEEMGVDVSSTKIKLIGTSGLWKLYTVELKFYGPGFYTPVDYVLSDGTQIYYVPVSNTDDWAQEYINSSLLPEVEVLSDVEGLPKYPSTFSYEGQQFESPTSLLSINEFSTPELNATRIDTVQSYDLFKSYVPIKGFVGEIDPTGNQESKELKGFYSRQIYLEQPITNYGKFYSQFFKFISNDNKVIAKFTDNRSKESVYSANADICGGYAFGMKVIKAGDLSETEFKVVGKTNEGESLYQITSKNNEVLRNLYYNEYLYSRYGLEENEPLSFEEFVALPTHFLYKDVLGDYVLFANEDYGSLAECGKPVVYLYPETTLDIMVQVDADITKSDPEYGTGWNVTAQPSGLISYKGQNYEYLYWDGFGRGHYPALNGFGYVVETSNVEVTIRSHLKQQGLNDKEISDFVEYWLPLMPNTKYVRLTWIGTKDMNNLAKLNISPKPDTLIRVFMDYEGLNTFESLKPQQFVAPERKGFTVVEWGGLLRD